jgi:septum formation protein
MMNKKIILASQSPRRKQLLTEAEIAFEVITAHSDENYPDTLPAKQVPLYIAQNKAKAVFNTLDAGVREHAIIIAADTVVVLDNDILGKPTDAEDAENMLQRLSGKVHEVITGVVLLSASGSQQIIASTTVHFNKLSKAQIQHYVKQYQPMDKAGAYAIQEWMGLIGIAKIEGDFYNVMGLPVNQVIQALQPYITQ